MKRHDLPWTNAIALEQSEPLLDDDGVPLPFVRDWLMEEEIALPLASRRGRRREEWLLSRIAAKRLAIDAGLGSDARELRIRQREIADLRHGERLAWLSLSHSGTYAAAAIGSEPVGIDIQVVRPISERATHLFLSDEEADAMGKLAIADRMLHYWCAKEAAWKALGGTVPTLRGVPLKLRAEAASGLRFDIAETFSAGEWIAAISRSTS